MFGQVKAVKLYGKDDIKRRLDDIAAKGRISHAVMFSGHSGSGRKTLARYTAQLLLCENHACGHCAVCRNIENDAHPDVIFAKRQCKDEKYRMEDLRDIISDTAVLPMSGNVKIYVFEDCDTMTPLHLNTLLKLIEEPSTHLRFVFTCENTAIIPETIMSRVTEFEVPDTPVKECERYLLDSGMDSAKAKSLAEMFSGNIGKCGGFDGAEGELIGAARTAAAAIGVRDFVTAGGALSKYQNNRAGFNTAMMHLANLFRDALALKSGCEAEYFGKKEFRKIADNFTAQEILTMLDAAFEIQQNEIYNLNLGLTGVYFISKIVGS